MKITGDQLKNNFEINQIKQRQNEFKAQLKNSIKKKQKSLNSGAEGKVGGKEVKSDGNEELKEAAEKMEALFVQKMFKEMRKAGFESNLFGDGVGRDYFEDMFYKETAKMTAQENSLGLAEKIHDQLKQK